MIRLKVNLNSSAGGVLYHYCRWSFNDLVSIVDNGICPSNSYEEAPHEAGVGGEPQPFISFSRTRDNPARIGFASGGYGIVYSKDRLSNLGRFEAFHHGGDSHESNNIQVKIPASVKIDIDTSKPQAVSFEFTDCSGYRSDNDKPYSYYQVDAQVTMSTGDSVSGYRSTDTKDKRVGEETKEWILRNKSRFIDFSDKPSYDGKPKFTFKLKMTIDKDIDKLPELFRIAVERAVEYVKRLASKTKPRAKGDNYFYVQGAFFDSNIYDEGEWIRVQNSPQFSYEELLDIIKKTEELEKKGDPNASVYYSYAHDYVEATIPTSLFGNSYRDLPRTLQTILSFQKHNETEDRLWLNPRFVHGEPGDYQPIPETCKAVVGIIVSDEDYFKHKVKEFRETHPDIPVYAYTETGRKKAPGVPPEAYKNPVA